MDLGFADARAPGSVAVSALACVIFEGAESGHHPFPWQRRGCLRSVCSRERAPFPTAAALHHTPSHRRRRHRHGSCSISSFRGPRCVRAARGPYVRRTHARVRECRSCIPFRIQIRAGRVVVGCVVLHASLRRPPLWSVASPPPPPPPSRQVFGHHSRPRIRARAACIAEPLSLVSGAAGGVPASPSPTFPASPSPTFPVQPRHPIASHPQAPARQAFYAHRGTGA